MMAVRFECEVEVSLESLLLDGFHILELELSTARKSPGLTKNLDRDSNAIRHCASPFNGKPLISPFDGSAGSAFHVESPA